MPGVKYVAARKPVWLAIVHGQRLLVVAASARQKLADFELSMAADGGPQRILDALTQGGISSTPDFALVEFTSDSASAGALSVVVRGALTVSVATETESEEVSGAGVSTWVERAFATATGFSVATAVDPLDSTARELPLTLTSGTAFISSIFAGLAKVEAAQSELPVVQVPEPEPEPESAPVSEPVPVPVPEPVPAPVPVPVPQPEPSRPVEAEAAEPDAGYDFLFGETVMRSVEDAAVRAAPEEAEAPVAGDHDGRTSLGLSAAARREARQARAPRVVPEGPKFAILFASGQRESLDRSVIVGRAPSANKVSADNLPRLVTVSGPEQDISRNHVQFSVEGGTVVVTDLQSRNGTTVLLPGRAVQQLRAGSPTAILVGTVVDLGSGVVITVLDA